MAMQTNEYSINFKLPRMKNNLPHLHICNENTTVHVRKYVLLFACVKLQKPLEYFRLILSDGLNSIGLTCCSRWMHCTICNYCIGSTHRFNYWWASSANQIAISIACTNYIKWILCKWFQHKLTISIARILQHLYNIMPKYYLVRNDKCKTCCLFIQPFNQICSV